MTTSSNVSEFEATIKPAPNYVTKGFEGGEMDRAWGVTQYAQARAIRLQRRAMVWAPAMLFLILGIFIGLAPMLPMLAKSAVVGVAGFVFAWVVSASWVQRKRTDALYARLPKSGIKIKEQE